MYALSGTKTCPTVAGSYVFEPSELGMKACNMQISQSPQPLQPEQKGGQSNPLGTARTVSSFIAGGTSAASAISSFVGVATLDTLVKDMNACDSYVREIKGQRAELEAEAPKDPLLAQMDDIIANCSGLNSRNIADVKGKMIATGVISATGAATGIAGGITSAVAGSKEKGGSTDTKGLNIGSSILTGTTTAAGLTSTILSGVVLSDLHKNGDVAARCASAF